MAVDQNDENKAILEMAHKAYWDEFREQSENWKAVEIKAQGMITTNGIFLIGAFAFCREASLSSPVIILTILTFVCIFCSMSSALNVLKAADFQMPVDAGPLIDIGGTFMMHPSQLSRPVGERLCAMYKLAFDEHRLVLATIETVLKGKVMKLNSAYNFLSAASFFAVISSIVHILSA